MCAVKVTCLWGKENIFCFTSVSAIKCGFVFFCYSELYDVKVNCKVIIVFSRLEYSLILPFLSIGEYV